MKIHNDEVWDHHKTITIVKIKVIIFFCPLKDPHLYHVFTTALSIIYIVKLYH